MTLRERWQWLWPRVVALLWVLAAICAAGPVARWCARHVEFLIGIVVGGPLGIGAVILGWKIYFAFIDMMEGRP